jgi:hypothetical protein
MSKNVRRLGDLIKESRGMHRRRSMEIINIVRRFTDKLDPLWWLLGDLRYTNIIDLVMDDQFDWLEYSESTCPIELAFVYLYMLGVVPFRLYQQALLALRMKMPKYDCSPGPTLGGKMARGLGIKERMDRGDFATCNIGLTEDSPVH